MDSISHRLGVPYAQTVRLVPISLALARLHAFLVLLARSYPLLEALHLQIVRSVQLANIL